MNLNRILIRLLNPSVAMPIAVFVFFFFVAIVSLVREDSRANYDYDASTRAAVEAAALTWAGPDGRLRGCGYLQDPTRCDVVTSEGVEAALLCCPVESVCVRLVGE